MSNIIHQTILDAWQRQKIRTSPSGWLSGNAVCCHHRGHKQDRRGRGGIIVSPDGAIGYSCFNCGFNAHYRPGQALFYKMRKLLDWLGVDEQTIRFLILESIRTKAIVDPILTINSPAQEITFDQKDLPEGSMSFNAWADYWALKGLDECPAIFLDAVDYVCSRNIDMSKYEFYWTNNKKKHIDHRVIIPFTHNNKIVGHSARSIVNWLSPKYLADSQPGYVFNIDTQQKNWETVIVCEGIFDALSIDALAVMHNEISEQQADIIDNLSKNIIVVPDWDKSGIQLVEHAIKFNWSVSFPAWREHCKDINEAVTRYGKLFVLKTILDSVEYNSLKIKLMIKKTRWKND